MPLTVGSRLAAYEIVSLLGAGGMGEVYRARDIRLKREVAIKVLPEAFATDPERLARFQREAELLATLNHPNIAAIYGLEKTDGVSAIVLELVEGETLADVLARGPIPIDEALPIARQIAEALEAAHEAGIIHRDLKPANIKLRPEGTVKVLDFGLAKLAEATATTSPSAAALSQSPTITTPAMMTGIGMILGTAAYMSPEQAKGRPADKRADIWAFGCVLYEMLTGTRAFEGDDVSETLASILAREPNWSALPDDLSASMRFFLQRSLTKDHRQRLRDVSVAQFVLDEASSGGGRSGPRMDATASRVARAQRVAALLAAAISGAVIAYAVIVLRALTSEPHIARFTINAPGLTGVVSNNARGLAISPDGTRIVYVGGKGVRDRQLFVRALNQLEPIVLTSSGGVRFPFFSPDGQWVAFFDRTNLRKVAVTGGAASTIAPEPPGGAMSGTWSEDGTIVVAGGLGAGAGLWKISAAGGEPLPLTKPDLARGETVHGWPQLLPGGGAVLFTVLQGSLVIDDNTRIALLDLRTGERKELLHGSSCAHYVPSGHIVYGRAGSLEAVAFNATRRAIVGSPVPLVTGVSMRNNGWCDFDVSHDGTLVYLAGAGRSLQRRLVWVDRQGREEPINVPAAGYTTLRLSRDETRIAMDINDGQKRDIWVWDLAREIMQRLTNDTRQNVVPVWTPDDRHVVYSAGPAGRGNLFWQSADGSGGPEQLTHSSNGQYASAVLPDNRIIFREEVGNDRDLMIVTRGIDGQPTPLVKTRFSELNGEISPDGKWLAYQANDEGQFRIYVRPFPNVADARSLVSTAGGTKPMWARNGRELFYFTLDGALMSVPVTPGNAWNVGKPTKILDKAYFGEGVGGARGFDVSADGQRFLMIKEDPGIDSGNETETLHLVLNWTEELKRLVPVR